MKEIELICQKFTQYLHNIELQISKLVFVLRIPVSKYGGIQNLFLGTPKVIEKQKKERARGKVCVNNSKLHLQPP